MLEALKMLGVPDADTENLQKVLAALLLLGNVTFAADSSDHAQVHPHPDDGTKP